MDFKKIFLIVLIFVVMLQGLFIFNRNESNYIDVGSETFRDEYSLQLQLLVDNGASSSEISEFLDLKLIEEHSYLADASVDVLMNSVLNSIDYYNEMALAFQKELKSINFSSIEEALEMSLSSRALEGFFLDLKSNYMNIVVVEGLYIVEPNINEIYQKYGRFVTEDLGAVLLFMSKESYPLMFADVNYRFDLDYLATRILMAEDLLNDFSDSLFAVNVAHREFYYYEVLFGINHNEFVDNLGSFVDEYVEHLYEIKNRLPDSKLLRRLEVYLIELEGEDRSRTANLDISVLDMLKEISEDVVELENSLRNVN